MKLSVAVVVVDVAGVDDEWLLAVLVAVEVALGVGVAGVVGAADVGLAVVVGDAVSAAMT